MTPQEFGEVADKWWAAYNERLDADKVAAALKVEESKLKAQIIDEMLKEKITAIGGAKIRLTMTKEEVPTVKDWAKVHEFIIANDAWDLMEKRIGKLAVQGRWEEGVEVPGVEKFPRYNLSRSQVK